MTSNYNEWLFNGCPKVFCECGCNEEIIIKEYHKRYGIPKYIQGHHPQTKETRQKISNNKKGKESWNKGKKCPQLSNENHPMWSKHHTEESNQKNREKHLGKEPWNKGILASEETKQKMRKPKTKEHKNNISNTLTGRYCGKDNSNFGKSPSQLCSKGRGSYYNSPLQGKVYLRSSYEIAYAKYLDEHKILWMYEMETFDLGNTTYTPDFFLLQFEKFIEIKGYMRKESQEKINKFLKQYPWNLEILYKEDLIKLGINL